MPRRGMEAPLLLPPHTVQGVVLPHFTGARLHSRPSQAWQLHPGVSPQQPLPHSGLPTADLEAHSSINQKSHQGSLLRVSQGVGWASSCLEALGRYLLPSSSFAVG